MESRNIILGCIYKMDVQSIRPYIQSLFATDTEAKLVLFCSHLSQETLDYINSFNEPEKGVTRIECLPFSPVLYKLHNPFSAFWPLIHLIAGMSNYNVDAGINRLFLKKATNLMCVRFYHYYEYLKSNRERYDRVILTDIRDVIFQSDPFKHFTFDGLESFCEDKTINNCPTNRQWIIDTFGSQMLERVGNEIAVCAGVVCGTTACMIKYLKIMLQCFLQSTKMSMVSGADQAIHNVIMHHQLGENLPVSIHQNFESYALTMGAMKKGDLTFDGLGRVLNHRGEVVSILHQYDRVAGFDVL